MVAPFAWPRSKPSQPRGRRDVAWRRLLLAGSLALLAISILAILSLRPLTVALALLVVAVIGIAAAHNVPCRPSREDEETGRALMAAAGGQSMDRPASFEDEVRLAYLVQQVVFDVAPFEKRDPEGRKVALPMGSRRELSDLVAAMSGYCFDRSRAIETLLRLHRLEVRHVSIFAMSKGESWLGALRRRNSPSHSLTEVKTQRGWMAIDSNFRFVAVIASGEPLDMKKLAKLPAVEWDKRNREIPPKITSRFTFVYGLYSRHGRFYPPYTRFPNVNWLELTYNFWR